MPDVQEVYEMVTQQKPPQPGALERQQKRQVRTARNKRIGAFAVAAAIGVAALVLILVTRPGANTATPAGVPSIAASHTSTSTGSVPIEGPLIGRNTRTVGDASFSFRVRTYGWERFDRISINKSIVGPQDAEVMIYWAAIPDGDRVHACDQLMSQPVGASVAAFASAVADAPGTHLLVGPSDVTLGGEAAKHVVVQVDKAEGCDPGYFFTWHDRMTGAFWSGPRVGDTIRVWIVDVNGSRLFIAAETTEAAASTLDAEIDQIIRSIRFD